PSEPFALTLADTAQDSAAVEHVAQALARDDKGRFVGKAKPEVAETVAEAPPVETAVADAPELEVAEAPATETAAAPDKALIEQAVIFGIPAEQAKALGDSLPSVLATLDRQAAQLMREELSQGEAEPAQPAQQVQQS